jgi:hypothetical protein
MVPPARRVPHQHPPFPARTSTRALTDGAAGGLFWHTFGTGTPGNAGEKAQNASAQGGTPGAIF